MCRAVAGFKQPPTAGPTPRTLWLVLAASRSFCGKPASASSPARPGAAGAQAPAEHVACDSGANMPHCSTPITMRSKHLPPTQNLRPSLFWSRTRFAELTTNCAHTWGATSSHLAHLAFLPLRPLPFLFFFLFLTSLVLLHGLLAASSSPPSAE